MSVNREPGGKTSPEEPLNLKKELLVFGLAILILAAFIYATGAARRTTAVRAEGRNLVRLHVVANSDDLADQAVKLKVRDRILKDIGGELASSADAKQALATAGTELGRIEAVARDELSQNGFAYGATAVVGAFSFPDRTYGSLVLPAGRYNALRVVLGEGKGQNWWCVLFPPLCLVDLAVETGTPATSIGSGVPAQGKDADGREVALVAPDDVVDVPFDVEWKVLEWLKKTTLGQIIAQVARPGYRQALDVRP